MIFIYIIVQDQLTFIAIITLAGTFSECYLFFTFILGYLISKIVSVLKMEYRSIKLGFLVYKLDK